MDVVFFQVEKSEKNKGEFGRTNWEAKDVCHRIITIRLQLHTFMMHRE